MNVEQTLIIKDRDLFSNAHNALKTKIVQALVNLYSDIIRSTADEIIHTALESVPHYVNASFIERYKIAVRFMGKDGNMYCKRAMLSVEYGHGDSGIIFKKELLS